MGTAPGRCPECFHPWDEHALDQYGDLALGGRLEGRCQRKDCDCRAERPGPPDQVYGFPDTEDGA